MDLHEETLNIPKKKKLKKKKVTKQNEYTPNQ